MIPDATPPHSIRATLRFKTGHPGSKQGRHLCAVLSDRGETHERHEWMWMGGLVPLSAVIWFGFRQGIEGEAERGRTWPIGWPRRSLQRVTVRSSNGDKAFGMRTAPDSGLVLTRKPSTEAAYFVFCCFFSSSFTAAP